LNTELEVHRERDRVNMKEEEEGERGKNIERPREEGMKERHIQTNKQLNKVAGNIISIQNPTIFL
jgi:hypothetical protein